MVAGLWLGLAGGVGARDAAAKPAPPEKSSAAAPSDWKTHVDAAAGYEFKHPADWAPVRPKAVKTPEPGGYAWRVKGVEHRFLIHVPTQARLDAMGVPYCASHPDDTAVCEFVEFGKTEATIEWQTLAGRETKAVVTIRRPRRGAIVWELSPLAPADKPILRRIVRSLRFLRPAPRSVSSGAAPAATDAAGAAKAR